jgi:hypothetical protein
MSEAAFYDKVPRLIDSEEISELYKLYDSYVDHVRADSRKRK